MSKILGDALQSEMRLMEMKRKFQGSSSSSSTFKPVLVGITRESVLKYDSLDLCKSSPASPTVLENEGHYRQYLPRRQHHHDGDVSCSFTAPSAAQKFELNPAHTHFILVRSEQKSSVSRVWNDVVETEQAGLRGASRGRNGRKNRVEIEKLHPMNLIENPMDNADGERTWIMR